MVLSSNAADGSIVPEKEELTLIIFYTYTLNIPRYIKFLLTRKPLFY